MSQRTWTDVDGFITDHLVPADPALEAALEASAAAGLPAINVAPNQGKFLHLLARMQNASNILEIGTLGGYSTIWLARALPRSGHLITLEYDPKHAEVARRNIVRAGLHHLVDIRVGAALETLPKIQAERHPPFDLLFIDADKQNNAAYFAWALKLARRGSVIVVDNVVRDGGVLNAASTDVNIEGVRRLYEMLSTESRVSATALQTVGSKGYDGFIIALVTEL